MKNKKSQMIIRSIVVLIVTVALIFVFFAGCARVRKNLVNTEDTYLLSFQDFVNGINAMDKRNKISIDIKLEKNSAVVGFSSANEDWKCWNCHDTSSQPTRVFVNSPTKVECVNNACICLCSGIKFEGSTNKLATCDHLDCETLNKEIASKTEVLETFWENGFLFGNHLKNGNGLDEFKGNKLELFVDKEDNTITVCNNEMRRYNKDNNFGEFCIRNP